MAMRAEELELIRRAQAGDIEARNRVVTMNMVFIVSAVQRAVGVRLAPDYLSHGIEAYIRAIALFDTTRGFHLTTYSSRAILNSCIRARHASFHKGVFETPNNRAGSPETRAAINEAVARARAARSLNASPSGTSQGMIESLAGSIGGPRAAERLADRFDRLALVRWAMGHLEDVERDVLTERCRGRSLLEIARDRGKCREWVRQIEMKAVTKVRALLDVPDPAPEKHGAANAAGEPPAPTWRPPKMSRAERDRLRLELLRSELPRVGDTKPLSAVALVLARGRGEVHEIANVARRHPAEFRVFRVRIPGIHGTTVAAERIGVAPERITA